MGTQQSQNGGEKMEYISTRRIAQLMGVTEGAVYEWLNKGLGPKFFKTPGGRIRILRDDFNEWFRALKNAA